jgi:hypothetical protein
VRHRRVLQRRRKSPATSAASPCAVRRSWF